MGRGKFGWWFGSWSVGRVVGSLGHLGQRGRLLSRRLPDTMVRVRNGQGDDCEYEQEILVL